MIKNKDILNKISAAGLVGRGGASYPTAKKWMAVKEALKTNKKGYIIVNGAEGEPGLKKDGYIFRHYAEEVIAGVYLADKFLGSKKIKKIYIFLNRNYYLKYAPDLRNILDSRKYLKLGIKTEFFVKPERLVYVSGEETALLNLLEGKRVEPRLKPPYPTEKGLFACPTLVHNPETFYNVSLVARDKFEEKRFYTIGGAARHPGVYELSDKLSVEDILRKTENYPPMSFFVQVGGGASGKILNSGQLAASVEGAGLIMIYDKKRTDRKKLFRYWLNFYKEQSCGQCTICREGAYRLFELLDEKSFDQKLFKKIIAGFRETSFCGLGASLPIPFESYFDNIKN